MVRNVLLAAALTFFYWELFGQQVENDLLSMQNSVWVEPNIPADEPKVELELGFAPNPFASEIIIHVSLPESGKISLKVFDILGQEVTTVFNGYLDTGQHKLKFLGEGLPAGRYYLHLAVGRQVVIKQVLKKN